VNGDVRTKNIVVLEGGRINGSVRMDDSTPGMAGMPVVAGASLRKPESRPALAAS
jgi:cytoskeletal protein CcmA (bactofilin family)